MITDLEIKFLWTDKGETVKWIGGESIMYYNKSVTRYEPLKKNQEEINKIKEEFIQLFRKLIKDEE